jgi:hypothetical protein
MTLSALSVRSISAASYPVSIDDERVRVHMIPNKNRLPFCIQLAKVFEIIEGIAKNASRHKQSNDRYGCWNHFAQPALATFE